LAAGNAIVVTVVDYVGAAKAGVQVGLDGTANQQPTDGSGHVTFPNPQAGMMHQLFVNGVHCGTAFMYGGAQLNKSVGELRVTVTQNGSPQGNERTELDPVGTNVQYTDANGNVVKYGLNGTRTVYVEGQTKSGWTFTLPGTSAHHAVITVDKG
jgi:hypothetical protein